MAIPRSQEWIVSPQEAGIRLSDFLRKQVDASYSAKELKYQLEKGSCAINGKIERFSSVRLQAGDRIRLSLKPALARPQRLFSFDKGRILYEDEHLLVYNKPVGLASDGHGLIELARSYHPGCQLVHRLDKETSGGLLLAKSATAYPLLCQLFRQRHVTKIYWAIADGSMKRQQGTVKNHVAAIQRYHGQVVWGVVPKQEGVEAITQWTVKQTNAQATWLECQPLTGRTHQIRVHLSHLGHPILGDYQYAKHFHCAYSPPRILLHAYRLAFIHPITQMPLDLIAFPPDDFLQALKQLAFEQQQED